MALDFFAGCLGGCAGIIVGYPLDTVKVHMQTQDYRKPQYRGTWHCFRTLLAKESVKGLYRGMSSPMAGVAAINAIVFGVYGHTQRHLTESDRLSSYFLAGAFAGIAQTPVCSPIELAKTRLQLQSGNNPRFSGPLECLRHIYKQEGIRGVFKGLNITLLREAPSYGVYFATYEALTRNNSNEPYSTPRMLLAGGLAGTASWVISYPVDVVKSRIQAECNNHYLGAWDCLKKSIQTEGYSCLYKGLNSTIIRAFPTNAATFAVVTWTFRLLGEPTAESKTVQSQESTLTTISRIPEEYDPILDKWNILLQRVSNIKTLQRSYYSAMSPTLNFMLLEEDNCYSCAEISRNSEIHGQKSCAQCKGDECELVKSAEDRSTEEIDGNQEDDIEWSIIKQTLIRCNDYSMSAPNSPVLRVEI